MGQTLSHGVYLPNEGERNCYAGLASNWQILNTAVGVIAEKAPLVHTHTVSQITDFPAYGTTAGTICEGNDSRLSDARTPVAHTHVTADVTDLLNTSHEWTKEQVCDEGFTAKSTTIERCVTPDTIKHINFTFKDKNNKVIGAVRRYFKNNGVQELQVFGTTKIKDGQYDETGSDVFFGFSESIKPDGTKTFTFDGYMGSNLEPLSVNQSIGSSTNQWNNLYAKNYYYNGTAWGLDTFNQWTGNNKFVSPNTNFGFKSTTAEAGSLTAASNWIYWQDKNDFQDAYISRDIWNDGSDSLRIAITSKRSNGAPSTTGTEVGCGFRLNIHANGNTSIDPFDNGGTDLGTSTNKWKSLNGINPGALSLPDVFDSYDVVTTNWSTAYNQPNDLKINGADPSYPGWLFIRLDNCTAADDFVIVRYFHVNATNITFFGSFIPTASSYVLSVPIQAGITTKVWVSKIPTTCKYYACLGTVK